MMLAKGYLTHTLLDTWGWSVVEQLLWLLQIALE